MNIVCVAVRATKGTNLDDWEIVEEAVEFTRYRAYVILGFGAVSSYFFTIGCLVRFLGFPVFQFKIASINLYFIGSTNIDDDINSCIEDGNHSEDEGRELTL